MQTGSWGAGGQKVRAMARRCHRLSQEQVHGVVALGRWLCCGEEEEEGQRPVQAAAGHVFGEQGRSRSKLSV